MKNPFVPENQIGDIDAKIIASIERLTTIFKGNLQETAKQNNLTPLQSQLLLFIAGHRQTLCSVTHLAKEFSVTKATVSDSLRVLVKKELLEKITDSHDNRAFKLAVTKLGADIVKRFNTLTKDYENLFSSLTDSKKESISNALIELLGLFQTQGKVPMRMCYSCQYYQPTRKGFHCNLMKKDLEKSNIRIDCHDHKTK